MIFKIDTLQKDIFLKIISLIFFVVVILSNGSSGYEDTALNTLNGTNRTLLWSYLNSTGERCQNVEARILNNTYSVIYIQNLSYLSYGLFNGTTNFTLSTIENKPTSFFETYNCTMGGGKFRYLPPSPFWILSLHDFGNNTYGFLNSSIGSVQTGINVINTNVNNSHTSITKNLTDTYSALTTNITNSYNSLNTNITTNGFTKVLSALAGNFTVLQGAVNSANINITNTYANLISSLGGNFSLLFTNLSIVMGNLTTIHSKLVDHDTQMQSSLGGNFSNLFNVINSALNGNFTLLQGAVNSANINITNTYANIISALGGNFTNLPLAVWNASLEDNRTANETLSGAFRNATRSLIKVIEIAPTIGKNATETNRTVVIGIDDFIITKGNSTISNNINNYINFTIGRLNLNQSIVDAINSNVNLTIGNLKLNETIVFSFIDFFLNRGNITIVDAMINYLNTNTSRRFDSLSFDIWNATLIYGRSANASLAEAVANATIAATTTAAGTNLSNLSANLQVINLTLSSANASISSILRYVQSTNQSTILNESFENAVLSNSANITLRYSISTPVMEGANSTDYAYLRMQFWFLNSTGDCIDQARTVDDVHTPICDPLASSKIIPQGITANFTISIKPQLPTGTYQVVRRLLYL